MGVEIAMQISKNIAFALLPGLIGVLFLITTAVEGKSGEYLHGEYGSDSSDTYDSEDIIYEGEEDIYYGDTLDETTLPGLAEGTDQAGIIDDTTLPSLAEKTDLKTKFKDNMRAVNEHLEQTLKLTKLANGN